jgi:hypothetical protein
MHIAESDRVPNGSRPLKCHEQHCGSGAIPSGSVNSAIMN